MGFIILGNVFVLTSHIWEEKNKDNCEKSFDFPIIPSCSLVTSRPLNNIDIHQHQ